MHRKMCARERRVTQRAHPIGEPVVNRPDLEIDRFQGTKRALDLGERFVAAHHLGAVHLLRGYRGTQDVDAIEQGFGGDPILADAECKARVFDFELEVLGHLVLVDDAAHAQPDLVAPAQALVLDHRAHLRELYSRGLEQISALVGA